MIKDAHHLPFVKRLETWFCASAVLPSLLRTYLRLILFMLGIALVLGACAPERVAFRKIKRNMAKVEAAIKAHPELADSLNLTRNEPITAPQFDEVLEVTPKVDSALVDSLAIELAKSKHELEAAIKSGLSPPITITKIREKLIRAACPDIRKDTTFYLTLIDGKDSLRVPLFVSLQATDGQLRARTSLGAIHWDRKRTTTQVLINEPERKFWGDPWFWVAVVLALLFVWVVIRR